MQKGDLYQSMGYGNFTPNSLLSDCDLIYNTNYQVYTSSPGITESADISWYDSMDDISYYCGFFSLEGVIFKDPALLTI
jgi:hypothetical protein